MGATATLYQSVVDISRDYLGPAADRFIMRQIATHLNKKPDDLTPDDLYKLIDWIKVATAVLTDDTKLIDDYEQRLRQLAAA